MRFRFDYKGYNPEFGFRITREKLEELSAQDLLHYGSNNIYKKIYSHESKRCSRAESMG